MTVNVWPEITRWVLEDRGLELNSWNAELGVSKPTREQRVLFAKILGSFAASYRLNERTSTLLTVGNAVRELYKQAESVNNKVDTVDMMANSLFKWLKSYADEKGKDEKNALANSTDAEIAKISQYLRTKAKEAIRFDSITGLYEAVLRTNCRDLGSADPVEDDFLAKRHPVVICRKKKEDEKEDEKEGRDDRPLVFLAGLSAHCRLRHIASEDEAINYIFQQAQKYYEFLDGGSQTIPPWEENDTVLGNLMRHSISLSRLISDTICGYLEAEVESISRRLKGVSSKTYEQVFGTINPDDAVKFSTKKNRL